MMAALLVVSEQAVQEGGWLSTIILGLLKKPNGEFSRACCNDSAANSAGQHKG